MRKLNLLLTLVALSFATTSLWAVPTGALPGGFTINNQCDMVYFSQGNLQYQGSTSTWRFAEHQYDYVGGNYSSKDYGNVYENSVKCDNMLNAEDYSGWIDMFGWGTRDNPWNMSTSWNDYSWHDWGENAISNGGNTPNSGWRTLTAAEWNYLFNTRTASKLNGTSNARYVQASLFGTNKGYILFPDNYTHPEGVALPTGINSNDNITANQYDVADWGKMEEAGCVFLPFSGYRYAFNGQPSTQRTTEMEWCGRYWASNSNKMYLALYSSYPQTRDFSAISSTYIYALTVRLVQDVPDEEEDDLRVKASVSTPPTAITSLVYSGSSQYLVNAAGTATGGTVKYRLGTSGSWSTTRPSATNAGTYTIQWRVEATSGCYISSDPQSIEVTIARASFTPAPMPNVEAASLTYNGTAQDLLSVSGLGSYSIQYSTDGITWSTTMPTGENAGNYSVYYKIIDEPNYEFVAPEPVAVTIAQADLDLSGVTLPESSITIPYDGNEHPLLEIPSISGATVWYKLGDGDWSTTPPAATDMNTYSVQYKIVPDDSNYKTVGPNTVTVTIQDYPTVSDHSDAATIATVLNGLADPWTLKVARTIYANDEYNTICLPFSLDASALAASPLAGFNRLKTLRGAKVTGIAPDLSIDILVEDATTIEAGIPYLISYPSAHADIVNPVFENVTETTTTPSATAADGVTFRGMFAQVHIDPYTADREQDYLFLGANSQLMWPASSQTDSSIKMRGFRAYFIIDRSVITPALAPKGTRARIVDAPKTATGIDDASAKFGESEKILENGILYIIRNGVRYNAQGQIVK